MAHPAQKRFNIKNPTISIRSGTIDPNGDILPALLHYFPKHIDSIDWNSVALAAIAYAEVQEAGEWK